MLDQAYPSVLPGPPRPSRILTPQGFSRHHGQERHVVPGGGTSSATRVTSWSMTSSIATRNEEREPRPFAFTPLALAD